MNNINQYKIPNIFPANEGLLLNDVYLIILNAMDVPPHLALSINGKLFSLSVKGPSVNGNLEHLLKLIRQRFIETIFIKLSVPAIFSIQQLRDEVKKHMLAYPRVDVGIATCLDPIKNFCSTVYEAETTHVNFVFDLLPQLYQLQIISSCYHLNLDKYLKENSFYLQKYTMYDIYEGIRKTQLETSI